MKMALQHTPWAGSAPPAESGLRSLLQAEGLDFYAWSNAPFEIYAPHAHDYDKVLYCVRGSITFQLVGPGTWYKLSPGDRLDLPAGTVHAAEVGEQGVLCYEAHKNMSS